MHEVVLDFLHSKIKVDYQDKDGSVGDMKVRENLISISMF